METKYYNPAAKPVKSAAAKPIKAAAKPIKAAAKPVKIPKAAAIPLAAGAALGVISIIPAKIGTKLKSYICGCGRKITPRAKVTKCSHCGCVTKCR